MHREQPNKIGLLLSRIGSSVDHAMLWTRRANWVAGGLVVIVGGFCVLAQASPQAFCAIAIVSLAIAVSHCCCKLLDHTCGDTTVALKSRQVYFCVILGGIPALFALTPAGIAWSVYTVFADPNVNVSWMLGIWLLSGLHVGLVLASPVLAMLSVFSQGLRNLSVPDYQLAVEKYRSPQLRSEPRQNA